MALVTLFLLARGMLASVFLSAAVAKLRIRREDAIPMPRLPLGRFAPVVAVTLPWMELVAAALLISPGAWPVGGLLSFVLFLSFTLAVSMWMRHGLTGSCRCGGFLPTDTINRAHALWTGSLALVSGVLLVSPLYTPWATDSGWYATDALVMSLPTFPLLAAKILVTLRDAKRTRADLDRLVFEGYDARIPEGAH